jgi:hypothetical protein
MVIRSVALALGDSPSGGFFGHTARFHENLSNQSFHHCHDPGVSRHAELRTLPGGTTQIAVTRIGCSVVIDGHELMNGPCHYRLTDNADMFMTLPEAATQISVNVSRRRVEGRLVRLWMQTRDGTQHRVSLGGVGPQGECQRTEWVISCPCWANQRVRICSWPLQANSPPDAAAPSELTSPSPGEAYFPPQAPDPPPSPGEQQINELSDRMDRMLEKLTKQPH